MTDVRLLEGFSPFEFANCQGPVVKMKVSYVVFIFKAFPNTVSTSHYLFLDVGH